MQSNISVVIPLFNKAPHIASTLESVLRQSVAPREIIVVDDGSTDGGGRIVETFRKDGVRLITQENAGVSAARNAGVQAASGEYVAFLDADDEWLPTHVETLAALLRDFPALGLYSTVYKVRLGGVSYVPRGNYPLGYRGRVASFFDAMANGLSLVSSTTACVSRERLLETGGFPPGVRHGEDTIVWMKLATQFGMAHAAAVTAIYNRDAVNRATLAAETGPPGSLVYLAEVLREPGASQRFRKSARRLFDRIAFATAAGMKEAGDVSGLQAIRQLAAGNGTSRLRLKLLLLRFVPSGWLTFARLLRQKVMVR
jgi:glycosyltransferase involved in cell wall biosynthesis